MDGTNDKVAVIEKPRIIPIVIRVMIIAILSAGCVLLWLNMMTVGTESAASAFEDEMRSTKAEVYHTFYNKSYEISEKANHVSNRVTITVDHLQKQAKLEVLKVNAIQYAISDEQYKNRAFFDITGQLLKDANVWLEVPASGVYTVNLKAGEYIVDDEHGTVLVRLPKPELSQLSIDYPNVKEIHFEEGGLLNKTSKAGEDEARKLLTDAQLQLKQVTESNQQFQKSAMDSTQRIITAMVKELNPDIPGLFITVEFY